MVSQLFEFGPSCAKEWDDFVRQNPRGSIHQVSAWKTFQEQIPGRGPVWGWGVREGGRIKAAVFCVQMDTGVLGKKWAYSARGPVFEDGEERAAQFLLHEVAKKLNGKGMMFWRADPYISNPETGLWKAGLNSRPATQNYQPTDTLVLDLEKPEEQLLKEMKRKGRYNIRLADKHAVTFRKIDGAKVSQKDLDAFWSLTQETTGRDEFSGHEKSYYQKFLKYLSPHAVLFFAEKDGVPVAAAVSTFFGDRAIYYFGASTSDPQYRPLMAPYGLQWAMIQEARKRNCRTYDFLGIAPEGADKHPYSGISQFKWKFGGERQTFLPGREIVFKKLWYVLYRARKKLR